MKKTQFIDIITTIKRTLVSFLAILLFVLLAVSMYTGMTWSADALTNGLDITAEDEKMHDLQVFFPYGVSNEDLEEIAKIPGVDEIEGAYSSYETVINDGERIQVQISEITKKIDTLILREGRIPEKKGEIAMPINTAELLGLKVGDSFSFKGDATQSFRVIKKISEFNVENDDLNDLENKEEDLPVQLHGENYILTGLVSHPTHLSNGAGSNSVSLYNGLEVSGYMYVTEDSFDKQAYMGYNNILIRSDELRGYNFSSQEYKDKSEALRSRVQEKCDVIAENNSDKLLSQIDSVETDADKKLSDASQQLEAAIAETNQKGEELEEGKKQLEEATSEISQNEQALEAVKKKLEDAEKEIAPKEAQLKDAERQLKDAKSQIDAGKAELQLGKELVSQSDSIKGMLSDPSLTHDDAAKLIADSGIQNLLQEYATIDPGFQDNAAKVDAFINDSTADPATLVPVVIEIAAKANGPIASVEAEIKAAEEEYNKKKAEFDSAIAQITAAKKEIEAGRVQYESGQDQLAQAKEQVEKNQQIIDEGEKQLNEAKEKLPEAENENRKKTEEVNSLKEELSKVKAQGCVYLTRSENAVLQGGVVIRDIVLNVRYSLTYLFLIVGLLVCYFTIVRMVGDQTKLIGTLKAIGFSKGAITRKYVFYTGIAAALGCVIGIAGGKYVIQGILLNTFNVAFDLTAIPGIISAPEIIFMVILELGLIIFVTWAATGSVLRKNAVVLLSGETTSYGKARFYERFGFFNRLSLINKTIVNNFFTDKRRVFGTFIGIAGCTSLLVSAFMLRFNVLNTFTKQYQDYFHFEDTIIYEGEDERSEILSVLSENQVPYTEILLEEIILELPDGRAINGSVMVPVDLPAFKERVTMAPCAFSQSDDKDPYQGVWLNLSCANYMGDDDTQVNLLTYGGDNLTMEFQGFFEYYLAQSQVYMDKESYESIYGKKLVPNSFIIDVTNLDKQSLKESINNLDGTVFYTNFKENSYSYFSTFERVSRTMVLIYIFLSVVMALIVLLNLLTMFVSEKKKELIILMINGYSIKTARRYISGDTTLLTVIGIIGGIILGCIIGFFAIKGFDTPMSTFIKTVNIPACIIGIAGTGVLSFIMCHIALRRINKFKLPDINN